MSKFIIYYMVSLSASAAIAFATAKTLDQFFNITGIALFSILLLAIAGVATTEVAHRRLGGLL